MRIHVLPLTGANRVRLGCPIVEWQQEVRNNWLCSGGCWKEEYCRTAAPTR